MGMNTILGRLTQKALLSGLKQKAKQKQTRRALLSKRLTPARESPHMLNNNNATQGYNTMATAIGTAFGVLFFGLILAIPVLAIVALWEEM